MDQQMHTGAFTVELHQFGIEDPADVRDVLMESRVFL